MAEIDVHCNPSVEGGWSCEVAVGEGGLDLSRHRVRVSGEVEAAFPNGNLGAG